MSADVAITDRDVTVRFHRRAHLPIVLDSDLFKKIADMVMGYGKNQKAAKDFLRWFHSEAV